MADVLFREESIAFGLAGIITLNRPKALHALTHDMVKAIALQLRDWHKQTEIKWVLIEASSGKAFCAGGDIRSVFQARHDGVEHLTQFFWDEYRLNHLIRHYNKPFIAWLDGITMGGGVGVSVHGSIRVGTPNTVLAMPETAIGFFPDVGGTYLLSRLKNKIGMYLGLTGHRINAFDAYQLGLVDYVVNIDKTQLLQQLFACESNAALTALFEGLSNPYDISPLIEHGAIEPLISYQSFETTVAQALHSSTDAAKVLQNAFEKFSPTALQVTYEAIRSAKSLSFDACLQMEYRLLCHFLEHDDFFEGVRALLIDKDKSPNWRPASIADVKIEQVKKYFNIVQPELHYRYE